MQPPPACLETPGNGLVLRLAGWLPEGAAHGFSTRRAWEAGRGGGQPWSPFLAAAGLPGPSPVTVRQVHGAAVCTVGERPLDDPPEADALVTRRSGLALGVATADCAPVLLADAGAGVIGAAHAGWRGALAGVLQRTVEAMTALGAEPARMRAVVGPTIGACCFEVGDEVAAPFEALAAGLVQVGPAGRAHVDLAAAAGVLLQAAGLPAAAVTRIGACTRCRTDLFFSYRREGGGAGRMLAAIALDSRNGRVS